jgi:hypothetical protein
MATPELHKLMIDATGALVLKAKYEHEDPRYKRDATSGAFRAKLNVLDQDPLDRYALEKINDARVRVQISVKRVRGGVHTSVVWLNDQVTTGTSKACKVYDAVATPAKKHYKVVASVPHRVHARLEQENRAIKGELELVQLKLAEARLQAREAGLKGAD